MALTTKQKQQLKARAHSLKPVVLMGDNGLTPAVQKEINRALTDHELIKVRMHVEDRALKKAVFQEMCDAQHAELIQIIGNIGVLFREKPQQKGA